MPRIFNVIDIGVEGGERYAWNVSDLFNGLRIIFFKYPNSLAMQMKKYHVTFTDQRGDHAFALVQALDRLWYQFNSGNFRITTHRLHKAMQRAHLTIAEDENFLV